MQLSHDPLRISASFDDPNLVSRGGLVPVMALAERAGLEALVRRHVRIAAKTGVYPEVKVGCLVAGMAAAPTRSMTWTCCGTARCRSCSTGSGRRPRWGRSCARSPGAMSASWRRRAGSCWRNWPGRRRCCPARTSSRSWTSTRCSGGSTGTRNKARRSGTPRYRARRCWSAG